MDVLRGLGHRLALAVLCALLLAGCDAGLEAFSAGQPGGRSEVAWPDRQVVFRHEVARGRLEAYSIRGDVALLGAVELPPSLCPTTMALDTAQGQLWLWSARGGTVVDARSLKVLARWEGEREPLQMSGLNRAGVVADVASRLQLAAVTLVEPVTSACSPALVAEGVVAESGALRLADKR